MDTDVAQLVRMRISERCLLAIDPSTSARVRAAVRATLPSTAHARLFTSLARRGIDVERFCAALVETNSLISGGLVARAVGPWNARHDRRVESVSDVDIFTSFESHHALITRLETDFDMELVRDHAHVSPKKENASSEITAMRVKSLVPKETFWVDVDDLFGPISGLADPELLFRFKAENTQRVRVPHEFEHDVMSRMRVNCKVDVVYPSFDHDAHTTLGHPIQFASHFGFSPCKSGKDIVEKSFDLSCCATWFDGHGFYAPLEAIVGIVSERITVTGSPACVETKKQHRLKERKTKYSDRGYIEADNAHDVKRIAAHLLAPLLPPMTSDVLGIVLQFLLQ